MLPTVLLLVSAHPRRPEAPLISHVNLAKFSRAKIDRGVHAAESGMVDVKDLRPYVMKLIPSARKRLAALPATRKALRDDLRAQIRKIGPSLGNLYFDKELNWAEITRETTRMSVAVAEEKEDAKKEK